MPTAMEMLAEVSEFPTSAAPDVQVQDGDRRGVERSCRSPAFLDVALSLPVFLIVSWAALKLR